MGTPNLQVSGKSCRGTTHGGEARDGGADQFTDQEKIRNLTRPMWRLEGQGKHENEKMKNHARQLKLKPPTKLIKEEQWQSRDGGERLTIHSSSLNNLRNTEP